MTTDYSKASDRIRIWRHEPVKFVQDMFLIEPDEWQKDTLNAIKPEGINRICMKACAGPGKTAVEAWLGWWWMTCFADRGEHPKGTAVAITAANLGDNLWPEFRKWQLRSPFLEQAFTWQKERIFATQHAGTWFLSARSFSKTADAQEQGRTLSGLHSEFPFVLLDESGDMNASIGRAAEQAMGGARVGLIVQAGNTTSMNGLLYDSSVTNAKDWRIISITADPDDPKRTPRVAIEWAREQIRKYGRENPWVMAYVLGLFPPSAFNCLLSSDQVEAAMARVITPEDLVGLAKILGLDVARYGGDRIVLFPRQGRQAFIPAIMRDANTFSIAARAAKAYNDWKADMVFLDGTGGYGGGPFDALHQANIRAIEIGFSERASDNRYFNKRSEMWFEMAEWVKTGGALPPIPDLLRELTTPMYFFQEGKFRLEEKDQIKKRLGFSPDLADALALTFAMPVAPHLDTMTQAITGDGHGSAMHLASHLSGRPYSGIIKDEDNYA